MQFLSKFIFLGSLYIILLENKTKMLIKKKIFAVYPSHSIAGSAYIQGLKSLQKYKGKRAIIM